MPKLTWGDQDAAQIQNVAAQLVNTSGLLTTIAGLVQNSGFGKLRVSHFDQMVRAIEYLENYEFAIRTALQEAQKERGDFGNLVPEADAPADESKIEKPDKSANGKTPSKRAGKGNP